MKVRTLSTLAAGLIVGGAVAGEPASDNQKLADAVATTLAPAAGTADVSIVVVNGAVSLTGTVKDAGQKAALVQQAKAVRGVVKVQDALTVGGVTQVQDLLPPAGPFGPVATNPPFGPVMTAPPVGLPPAMSYSSGGPQIDPIPLGGSAGMGMAEAGAPPLPAHAWPTYAPYNNLSRVAYPQAYPYNAFPYIGPFYPFPKVPLGWRSVQLQWEDGHWWLGRTQAPQDYWRVRFW